MPTGLTTSAPSCVAKLERGHSFELTRRRSELLMLTNHRPRNESVLDVLIEECETRFDADQQAEILKVVREVYKLPDPESEEEQAAEGAMEGVENG